MPPQPQPVAVDPSQIPKGTKVIDLPPSSAGPGLLGQLLAGGAPPAAPKEKAGKKKETAAEKAAAKQAEEQKALQAQIAQVNASPWTKLGNALAQEYQQAEVPVQAAISGQGIPQAQENAASSALGLLGLSPSSGAGQWLASQTAAANAETAPVAAAMGQEGAQYAAEAGPISQAIMAYGQANALSDITAPESAWLNALSSHITSNLSYYGLVPTAALPSLSPSVAEALKLSGGYGGAAGAGTTPLQNVQPSGTGGSKAGGPSSTAGAFGSSPGVIPGAGTNPGS